MPNPFKSNRIRRVPDPEPVPSHLTGMGWSPASDNGKPLPLDPVESERVQRAAGAAALADLAKRDAERKREDMNRRLGNAPRGHDYRRLNFRGGA